MGATCNHCHYAKSNGELMLAIDRFAGKNERVLREERGPSKQYIDAVIKIQRKYKKLLSRIHNDHYKSRARGVKKRNTIQDDEKNYIKCVIKIQSMVRKFLFRLRYQNYHINSNRTKVIDPFEPILGKNYAKKIIKIQSYIRKFLFRLKYTATRNNDFPSSVKSVFDEDTVNVGFIQDQDNTLKAVESDLKIEIEDDRKNIDRKETVNTINTASLMPEYNIISTMNTLFSRSTESFYIPQTYENNRYSINRNEEEGLGISNTNNLFFSQTTTPIPFSLMNKTVNPTQTETFNFNIHPNSTSTNNVIFLKNNLLDKENLNEQKAEAFYLRNSSPEGKIHDEEQSHTERSEISSEAISEKKRRTVTVVKRVVRKFTPTANESVLNEKVRRMAKLMLILIKENMKFEKIRIKNFFRIWRDNAKVIKSKKTYNQKEKSLLSLIKIKSSIIPRHKFKTFCKWKYNTLDAIHMEKHMAMGLLKNICINFDKRDLFSHFNTWSKLVKHINDSEEKKKLINSLFCQITKKYVRSYCHKILEKKFQKWREIDLKRNLVSSLGFVKVINKFIFTLNFLHRCLKLLILWIGK
jgi:hypothetical protein